MRLLLRRMFNAQDILNPSYGLYTVLGHPSLSKTPPQEQATVETGETLEPMSNVDTNVCDTPETPETVETLATPETVSDFDLKVSETFEAPGFSDSHGSNTPETVETLEAPHQTPLPPPIDLDSITNKIRTIFYCSRDNHYVQWRVADTRRIGCPLCDSWLVL